MFLQTEVLFRNDADEGLLYFNDLVLFLIKRVLLLRPENPERHVRKAWHCGSKQQ